VATDPRDPDGAERGDEAAGAAPVEPWAPERVDDLLALTDASLADEQLSADELLAACWEGGASVLGIGPPGEAIGAVSVMLRRFGDVPVGFLQLLVVAPGRRRQGMGRALLEAAEQWTWAQGARELHASGSAPNYLWPGVDVHATAMLCLLEAAGWDETGAALDMRVPAAYRAPSPAGCVVQRVVDDADARAVITLVEREWPEWVPETARALDQGTCLAAFDVDSGDPIGFACHSVNRAGWFGPTGTAPAARHRGVGLALLGEVCADLMVAGFRDVEICWIGPVGFYAAAGGEVSRVYRTARRRDPDARRRG
jgi:GNAT superfamily N-acetyltransferase